MTVKTNEASPTAKTKSQVLALMTEVTPDENKVYRFDGTTELAQFYTLPGKTTVDGDRSVAFVPGGHYTLADINRLFPAAYIESITVLATGAAPDALPAAGGTVLKVTGRNLTGVTAFTFGGTAASLISVVSENELNVTAPAKTAGSYTLAVTDDSGSLDPDSISLTNAVTYV